MQGFFANLLPEEEIRNKVARQLGISKNNDFMLLKHIGGDCAGAISFYSENETPTNSNAEYRLLQPAELNKIIRELPNKPFLIGEEGLRLSLAGAQIKLPVFFANKSFIYLWGTVPARIFLSLSRG